MFKITVGVEGMACGMCEAHVNDAVRSAFSVKKVNSSHTKKETVIITESDISESELTDVITKTGYEVVSVEKQPYESKGFFASLRKK